MQPCSKTLCIVNEVLLGRTDLAEAGNPGQFACRYRLWANRGRGQLQLPPKSTHGISGVQSSGCVMVSQAGWQAMVDIWLVP